MNNSISSNQIPSYQVPAKKNYTIIHGLWCVWYDKAFYAYAAQNWRALSFVFLCLFTLGLSIGKLNYFSEHLDELQKYAPNIIQQLPALKIDKGIAEVVGEQRVYLIGGVDQYADKIIFIIDTIGEREYPISYFDEHEYLIGVLTKNEILFNDKDAVKSETLEDFDGFSISPEELKSWFDSFAKGLFVVFIPFYIFFAFVYRIFIAIFYSVIALIFKPSGLVAPFGAIVSLAIFAMVPAMVLGELNYYYGLGIPFWGLVGFVITVLFLRFAMRGLLEYNQTHEEEVSGAGI